MDSEILEALLANFHIDPIAMHGTPITNTLWKRNDVIEETYLKLQQEMRRTKDLLLQSLEAEPLPVTITAPRPKQTSVNWQHEGF